MRCVSCGKEVTKDEIGITKKLVNRGTEDFYCKECLAKHFRMEVRDVDILIEHFRAAGCTLFK